MTQRAPASVRALPPVLVFSIWSCFVCFVSAISTVPHPRPPKAPHIVICIIDDLGWADVSYRTGVDGIHTPTIDKLAAEGVTLDQYYTQPVCSPSRSALLQGRWPHKTGLQHFDTIMPTSYAAMPLDKPTISEVLKNAGYRTAATGKWHCGYASWLNTPIYRGFETHTGYFQGEIDYYAKNFTVPKEFLPWPTITGIDWWENRTSIKNESKTYNKDLMDRATRRVLESYTPSEENPLFLYYAHQIAHVPLEVPQPWLANCSHIKDAKRHTYCGMLAAVDDSLRLLIEQLQEKNMYDDTVIVVTTDNGGMPAAPGVFPASAGVNFPLRAGKGTLFQGGVRGIGYFWGGKNILPDDVRGRTVDTSLTHVVDWAPTLLNLTAGRASIPEGIDGMDLWDVLVNDIPLQRKSLPLNINWNISFPSSGHQVGILTIDGWKLVYDAVEGPVLRYDGWFPAPPAVPIPAPPNSSPGKFLFNIFKDPNEHENLFSTRPEKVAELEALLAEYMKSYHLPQPNEFHVLGVPELHDGEWRPFHD